GIGMGVREDDGLSGAFINSLKRNNKEIRDDRATAIAEDTELVFLVDSNMLQYLYFCIPNQLQSFYSIKELSNQSEVPF
ncbi:MAG: hypothetical protein D3910_11870, partial [Candidatus Electrothrix sp. ATG2]|nr:hypothetical protein [Candidatus Electrothrix sp. ATG2]